MNSYGKNAFLTTEWKHLAMLNYEIEPTVLMPFVPAGTELVPIPFHRDFEEVNLRMYTRGPTRWLDAGISCRTPTLAGS